MDINVEGLAVTVDRDVGGGVGGGDGVEDLATDSVHTHHGDPGLGGRVIGVSRTWDCDPVSDTLMGKLLIIYSTDIHLPKKCKSLPKSRQRCRGWESLQ